MLMLLDQRETLSLAQTETILKVKRTLTPNDLLHNMCRYFSTGHPMLQQHLSQKILVETNGA